MSDTATRVPLEQARQHAEALVALLGKCCERVSICGSIRRNRPDIGDIDLLCEPVILQGTDMFGGPGLAHSLLNDRLDTLVDAGILTKRLNKAGQPAWGETVKRAVYQGLNVDFQICTDPNLWGIWRLIRTGPKTFNRRLMTPRRNGGILPAGCQFRGGFLLWKWGERIATPTEESVFEALGLTYLEPWERT